LSNRLNLRAKSWWNPVPAIFRISIRQRAISMLPSSSIRRFPEFYCHSDHPVQFGEDGSYVRPDPTSRRYGHRTGIGIGIGTGDTCQPARRFFSWKQNGGCGMRRPSACVASRSGTTKPPGALAADCLCSTFMMVVCQLGMVRTRRQGEVGLGPFEGAAEAYPSTSCCRYNQCTAPLRTCPSSS
jgi:hypothetical protein